MESLAGSEVGKPEPSTVDPEDMAQLELSTCSDPSGLNQRTRPTRKRAVTSQPFCIREYARPGKGGPASAKPKQPKNVEDEYETNWICADCREAECMMKPEADQLLVCDGVCRRLFHYPCAGLSELPPEEEEYVCRDCAARKHACAICNEYGSDDWDVFRCSRSSCGLFFHESCLAMQNVELSNKAETIEGHTTLISPSEGSDESADAASLLHPIFKRQFICPAHSCWTCTQQDLLQQESETAKASGPSAPTGKGRKKSKQKTSFAFRGKTEKRLFRCLECPMAYHITCIPPMARFHELALLCHEHAASHKLPELDPEASLQGKIEKAIDTKYGDAAIVRRRAKKVKGGNPFFVGITGDKLTEKESHLLETLRSEDTQVEHLWFCLSCDIRDEVHSKPPSYRHVQTLQYDSANRPSRIPESGEVCHCVGFCGEECLNRMLYVECHGTNCRVGQDCGNRFLGQRKWVKCKPQREQGKGWGLVTVGKVAKGELVQEYVGEVIDAKLKEERLIQWTEEHPNDPNFYVMELSKDWFIDARHVSNLARFINHSCEPNCALTRFNVGGYMRNGIFALSEIAPGEFLSYDYQFDTRQGDRFSCRCGSSKCRGTMKGGKQLLTASVAKTKSEIWEEAKARFDRDKRFVDEFFESQESRRSLVDASVPSAESKDEIIANGPQRKYRSMAIRSRIFLWRNVQHGSDMISRYSRLSASIVSNNTKVS